MKFRDGMLVLEQHKHIKAVEVWQILSWDTHFGAALNFKSHALQQPQLPDDFCMSDLPVSLGHASETYIH